MEQFRINYFNQKEVGYFGTLERCIEYADDYQKYLCLNYIGRIEIKNCRGEIVAYQQWETKEDEIGEYAEPTDWVRV